VAPDGLLRGEQAVVALVGRHDRHVWLAGLDHAQQGVRVPAAAGDGTSASAVRRGLQRCPTSRPLERDTAQAVSEENVDKTRQYIENYNRRDFDAALRDCDPQVEWVLPAHQRSDSGVGHHQIRRFWEGLDETFDELRLDPQEFVDGGDTVAVRLRYYGRGKGSGLELETEMYHQVTTFRDGVIVRLEYVESWPEALEAAGIHDHPAL
jgi:ketosteroid isomerase-like protein